MIYDKILLDKVYEMYIREMFGYNEKCLVCRNIANNYDKELINGPLPIFHIGKEFAKLEKRLFIVGMVAYNWSDIIPNPSQTWHKIFENKENEKTILQDKIENRIYELITAPEVKFMYYLNYALTKIFESAENGFNNIALSNFVHCNNNSEGETKDKIPQYVRNICADKIQNGFIFKEIEIINPTHVLGLSNDEHYTRFMNGIDNNTWKFKAITHPSAPGRSYEGFTNDILDFLNT